VSPAHTCGLRREADLPGDTPGPVSRLSRRFQPTRPATAVALRTVRATFLLGLWLATALGPVEAQQPTFVPDDPGGIYEVGAPIGWTVTAPPRSSTGEEASYTYTVRKNGGEAMGTGTFTLSEGRARVETALDEPGMVLVEIRPSSPRPDFGDRSTGGPGRVLLGAAAEPTSIVAAEPAPGDFDEFWAAKIAQLEAIPMGAVVTPGETDVPNVEYATFRLNNINRARVFGQVARPVAEGRYPGLVIYQWAGGPYPLQKSWVTDRAAEGWLAVNVMPHDVPGDLPQAFYDALPAMIRSYQTIGQHSRDESYFLQMYLGAYRAVEYLASRPDWDGETIVVMGTSMGGQQSFAAAGLNPRVDAMIVHVPAGADVTAAFHGRGASYPNWAVSRPEVLVTARYFDAANFAPRITARSLVSMGFIDEISTPAGIWAAFNAIRGPKESAAMSDASHNHMATAEQQLPYTTRASAWLNALVRGELPPPPP
jgi:cephalosporin-C deacetylase